MPCACLLINLVKVRADGYRLCRTLQRPFPRKANGIGVWRNIFISFAFIAIVVNVLLFCLSTGSLEFYSDLCIQDFEQNLRREGKTLKDFVMGPDFYCMHFTVRLILIIILEHVFLYVAYMMMKKIPGIPAEFRHIMDAREHAFKKMLEEHASQLPLSEQFMETCQKNQIVDDQIKPLISKEIDLKELKKEEVAVQDKAALARQWLC
jgi:hypothetical protein